MTKQEVVELRGAVKYSCDIIPGLSVIHRPVMYCFAMELGAARGQVWLRDLPQLARNLIEKYVEKGVKREHLESLVRKVFYVEPAKEAKPNDPFILPAAKARQWADADLRKLNRR